LKTLEKTATAKNRQKNRRKTRTQPITAKKIALRKRGVGGSELIRGGSARRHEAG